MDCVFSLQDNKERGWIMLAEVMGNSTTSGLVLFSARNFWPSAPFFSASAVRQKFLAEVLNSLLFRFCFYCSY